MSETAEWTTQTIEPDVAPKAGGSVVVFYPRQIKNEFQSTEQNRPVFIEKIFCKIITGGENLMVWDQPVRPVDKQNYAAQWERWLKTKENRIAGTPIEMWHAIGDTQKAELKALNIFTIEQFANLPDALAGKIMGFYDLRKKAQVFLEAGKDAELMARIRAEADEKMKGQQAQIDMLMAKLTEMQARQTAPKPERKRPGRKPGWNKKVSAGTVPAEG
jgi:hypothetical protein